MSWRLGVVGYPIEHSLSPQLHEAGLALAHLAGNSLRMPMRDAAAENLRGLMGAQFDALSVTMPLKESASAICDELDEPAERTGVVNSLLWRDGRVLGANTDGAGLLDSLEGQFAFRVEGATMVVIGAGGAARGIVDALVEARAGTITVLGRTATRVQRLTSRYANVLDHVAPGRLVDLVVNTVPVHARDGFGDDVPGLNGDTVAVDVTYQPRTSTWLARMNDEGRRTSNGLAMLAYQAARQMRWWWDRPIDGAALLEAIQ
jgi:shikimate dehydrogenase